MSEKKTNEQRYRVIKFDSSSDTLSCAICGTKLEWVNRPQTGTDEDYVMRCNCERVVSSDET